MIGALRGEVVEVEATLATVDVSGVGYVVHVTPSLAASITLGETVRWSISTQVREDAITLFGFADAAGRRAFEVLLSVHGVGPNLALAILSALDVDQLAVAIEADAVDVLCAVPGVGKKTAQRLALELKGKFAPVLPVDLPSSTPVVPGLDELLGALEGLGFTRAEAQQAAAAAAPEDPLDLQLKVALRSMAGRR